MIFWMKTEEFEIYDYRVRAIICGEDKNHYYIHPIEVIKEKIGMSESLLDKGVII